MITSLLAYLALCAVVVAWAAGRSEPRYRPETRGRRSCRTAAEAIAHAADLVAQARSESHV